MAGGLERDRAREDRRHRGRTAARAQRLLHVELVVVEQAEMELAVRGQAHAVARPAVRLADGTDEADHAFAVREAEVLRLVGGVTARDRKERPQLGLDALP